MLSLFFIFPCTSNTQDICAEFSEAIYSVIEEEGTEICINITDGIVRSEGLIVNVQSVGGSANGNCCKLPTCASA